MASIVLTALLVSYSFSGFARADYFSPAPPTGNVVSQTEVTVALPTPATAVYINVTEYDAQHMIKNITIDLREPTTYVGLVIDVLKDKPLIVNAPKTVPIIQYYDIRFLNELADKITNVTIVFAVEKATLQNMSVEEDDLLYYQYNESKFDVCPIQKVSENKTHLLLETETTVSSCFVIAGAAVPTPWWVFLAPIAVLALVAIVGIYVYRKYGLNRLENPVRT